MAAIGQVAVRALIALLMQLATQEFFKEVFIMLAEMAAKSSKTDWDDKFVDAIKKQLHPEVKNEEQK